MGITAEQSTSAVADKRTAGSNRYWQYLLVSILVIVPCLWHKHVEAGDLGSHVYNAWLVTQIEAGHAPGLYVAPQRTNVITDVALTALGRRVGFTVAERVVVSLCVLVFVWGVFAFVSAAAQRRPWPLIPLIAMLAYGYSFEMGFLNYYLSMGIAFWSLALIWRPASVARWVAAGVLAVVAAIAHPFGLVVLIGVAAYAKLAEALRNFRFARRSMMALCLIGMIGLHLRLRKVPHHTWEFRKFYLFNGADQFWLFGTRYLVISIVIAVLSVAVFIRWYRKRRRLEDEGIRTARDIWVLLIAWAFFIPEMVVVGVYPAYVGPLVSRTTTLTAVLGLVLVLSARPPRWYVAACSALAAVFFGFLYADTGKLARMEANAAELVQNLPPGSRVVQTIGAPADSRIQYIGHLVERAFIGHAFSYANYEPPTQQFRVRIQPGCRISAATSDAAWAMETGEYRPLREELPLKQVFQCDAADPTRLCIRDLAAGEPNCPRCPHPSTSVFP